MAKFAVTIDPRSLFRLLHDANQAGVAHRFAQRGYDTAQSGPLQGLAPQHNVVLIWDPDHHRYPETTVTLNADGTWEASCVLEGAES